MRHRLQRLVILVTLPLLIACAGLPQGQRSAALAPPSATPIVPTATQRAATATPAPPAAPTAPPSTATAPAPPTATAQPAPAATLALVGATLIDGRGGPPLPDAVVVISGTAILAAGRAAEVVVPPGTPTRDVGGMTIMPGFINAHAHSDELDDGALAGWTRAGVTTVRDIGGPRRFMLERRADVAAKGDPLLPRLLVAGPIITVPGGHPIPVYGPNEGVLTVRGPQDARAKVNELIDEGANVIKIAVSGRTDVSWPELSDDEIRAIAEAAHGRGVRVTAHIDRAVALRRAVAAGIDDAAHMPRDPMPDDLIRRMVEGGVALVPTIDVYEELAESRGGGAAWRRTTLPVMQDNLRRFVAAGGTLALGDDFGNPGVALGMPLAEIRHWLAAGLTPMQAIVAATAGGAAVCGLSDEIGTIEAGKAADLLIVRGDPLADIAALEQVALVLRAGQVVAER